MTVSPDRNSTIVTVPSLSAAFPVRVMLAGAGKVAPSAGPVSWTVGGTFGAGLTVMDTAADVVVAPLLSVARALSV